MESAPDGGEIMSSDAFTGWLADEQGVGQDKLADILREIARKSANGYHVELRMETEDVYHVLLKDDGRYLVYPAGWFEI
jgi:hypothetical protein